MKKKYIIIVLITIIAVSIAYVIISNISCAVDNSDKDRVSTILMGNDCAVCHTADAAKPFYASFPIVGTLVNKDIQLGYRNFDLTPIMNALAKGENVSHAAISKIWRSIETGRMPLHQYKMIHWSSNVASKEKDIIFDWVNTSRQNCNYSSCVAEEFKNEPIKPVTLIPVDSNKVAIGFKMFHDTRLSIDNTLSCASCHGLNTGGVDNKIYSDGVNSQVGGINAPTVYNAVFNHLQFWDGRAKNLAEQAAGPPENPVEMGAHTWDDIVAKLNTDKELVNMFSAVYPEGVTKNSVTDAIAEFEKTLVTPNSKFDKYLMGDMTAINDNEKHGYTLFKQFDCHTCHAGVNIGGESFELMGLHKDYFEDRGNGTDADLGRFSFTANDRDKFRLKTPTLRNIALTAPYYHDGTVNTLDEAVEKMVKYQTRYSTISKEDVNDIVAFMNTLTGEYNGKLLVNRE